jgi:hypothetical protein
MPGTADTMMHLIFPTSIMLSSYVLCTMCWRNDIFAGHAPLVHVKLERASNERACVFMYTCCELCYNANHPLHRHLVMDLMEMTFRTDSQSRLVDDIRKIGLEINMLKRSWMNHQKRKSGKKLDKTQIKYSSKKLDIHQK